MGLVLLLALAGSAAAFHNSRPAVVQELLTIRQVDYVRVAHELPGEHRLQFVRLAGEQEEALLAILADCRYVRMEERYYLGEQDIVLYIILGGESISGEKDWNDLIFYADGLLRIYTKQGEQVVSVDQERLTELCAALEDLRPGEAARA